MPHFTVRVELPGATPKDIELLDVALEEQGFHKHINTPIEVLRLPIGEYNYHYTTAMDGPEPTAEGLGGKALATVKETTHGNMLLHNTEPQIVVTKCAARWVYGLMRT